jgi:hypothetical protein
LSRLIVPNIKGDFTFDGRNVVFNCNLKNPRSLVLKEGITDGVLEVFVLTLFLR